jgi:hypothetical protein
VDPDLSIMAHLLEDLAQLLGDLAHFLEDPAHLLEDLVHLLEDLALLLEDPAQFLADLDLLLEDPTTPQHLSMPQLLHLLMPLDQPMVNLSMKMDLLSTAIIMESKMTMQV